MESIIEKMEKEIDGFKFEILLMPTLKAMVLDKKLSTLLIPALGGIKDLESRKVDFKLMAEAVATALGNLPDNEFQKTLLDLLSHCRYKGEKAVDLTEDVINTQFRAKSIVLYKLVVEVMKFNNFIPFELLDGLGIAKMLISKSPEKKQKNKSQK